MKNFILFIFVCLMSVVSLSAAESSNFPSEVKSSAPSEITCMPPVTLNDLPIMARQMIITNFGLKAVVSCQKTHRGTRYLVRLTEKRRVFFDEVGHWLHVDGGKQTVPEMLIPSKIRNQIAEKYGPYVHVVKIMKKDKEIKVVLDNQVKLTYEL